MTIPTAPSRWRRAEGLMLHGEYGGSGYREPRYLAMRCDGQAVHLTKLLYLVLEALEDEVDVVRAAELVSRRLGQTLDAAGLTYLLENKLEPLGLVAGTARGDGDPAAPKADALLVIRLHVRLIGAPWVRRLGAALSPLFWPPVVVAVLVGLVVLDGVLLMNGSLNTAVSAAIGDPGGVLLLLALTAVASLFHELGHAAGCHRGGGRPGAIGMGLYLIFPAFYTDVTDAYRLSRRARLRTDLGGVYFTAVACLVIGGIELVSGWPVLRLGLLLLQIGLLQQLLPLVRLDGYFILGDLVGVPDLFGRIRPILRGLLPGRGPRVRMDDLRPHARRVIRLWVCAVTPLLGVGIVVLLAQTPTIVWATVSAWQSVWGQLAAGWAWDRVVPIITSTLLAVISSLPILGLTLLAVVLGRRVVSMIGSRFSHDRR